MKKILNNRLFLVIVTALICTSVTVLGANFLAKDIKYTPADNTWGVDNVEAAINSLQLSKTSDNYSTEEQVVGTWVDGRPVYQKTIIANLDTTTADVKIASTLSDVDTIVSLDGISGESIDSDKKVRPLNYAYRIIENNNIVWGSSIAYDIDTNMFEIYRGNIQKSNVTKYYIYVQYTKTTDTATN